MSLVAVGDMFVDGVRPTRSRIGAVLYGIDFDPDDYMPFRFGQKTTGDGGGSLCIPVHALQRTPAMLLKGDPAMPTSQLDFVRYREGQLGRQPDPRLLEPGHFVRVQVLILEPGTGRAWISDATDTYTDCI
ncbi:MAG: hypothetical protein B7733_06205 [Myxococcales bacterium FL481]|nr:MAG: hypothetical protein B7733_06205 [Myxococcales bacterium FL481]